MSVKLNNLKGIDIMKTYKIDTDTYIEEISGFAYFIMKSIFLVFSIESRIDDFYTGETKPFKKRYFAVRNRNCKYVSKHVSLNGTAVTDAIEKIAEEMDMEAFKSTNYICPTDTKINSNIL